MRWIEAYEGTAASLAWTQSAAVGLFGLTAALLLLTYRLARQDWAEISAWGSLATVVVAIHFMLVSWHATASRHMPFATTPRISAASVSPVRDCDVCPEMVVVPTAVIEIGREGSDVPPHLGPVRKVMIPRRFAITKAAVSAELYRRFADATGRTAAGMSHRDTEAFAAWLGALAGKAYRLPSAAEWEHAMRAGSPRLASVAPEAGANGFGLLPASSAEFVADCWSATLLPIPSDARPFVCVSPLDRRKAVVKMPDLQGADLREYSGRSAVVADAPQTGVAFRLVREVAAER